MISSSQRPLPDNTRQSQQTNIHVPGGIQTHDLSRWAAAGRSPAEIVGSNAALTSEPIELGTCGVPMWVWLFCRRGQSLVALGSWTPIFRLYSPYPIMTHTVPICTLRIIKYLRKTWRECHDVICCVRKRSCDLSYCKYRLFETSSNSLFPKYDISNYFHIHVWASLFTVLSICFARTLKEFLHGGSCCVVILKCSPNCH